MWNRRFVSLCLILIAAGLVTAPTQLLLPVYVEDVLGKTVWFAAKLRAIPIALGGLFALVGGALSDRFGRKLTVILGLTGALVVGGVFISKQPLLILGILCYQGVASGLSTAGGQSYLISSVNAARLGLATAIYFLSGTFGMAIGNAIGGELIARFGYGVVGIGAILMMGAIILAAILFLPDLPRNLPPAGGGERPPKRGKQESLTQMLTGYRQLLRRREMRLLLGMRFLPTYYWGTVNLLMPVLINRAAGVKMAGYYGTLSLVFASLCQILTGRVCDAIGTRIPAFVTTCLIALSAGLIALSVNSVVLLYASGILGAGAAWSLSVTMPRFINEFSDADEKGHGVGITHLAWSAGFLSGQVVSGWLEAASVSTPFVIAGGLVTISAGLALRLWLYVKTEN